MMKTSRRDFHDYIKSPQGTCRQTRGNLVQDLNYGTQFAPNHTTATAESALPAQPYRKCLSLCTR
jgi:hypothetical protein